MNWFILSILAGFCFAVSRTVSRGLLKKEGNALAFTALHNGVAGLILLPLVLMNFQLPKDCITWLILLGIIIFVFISDWLAFVALKMIDVSEYQIANQTRHIFILIGGLIVFNEGITVNKIFAISLIIIGVVVALYKKQRIKIDKGVWLTIISTFAAVVSFLLAKAAMRTMPGAMTAATELFMTGVLCLLFLRVDFKKVIAEARIQKWGLIISGAVFGLFELATYQALKIGESSRVVPVTQISLIFTLILSYIFLRERNNIFQKIGGICIIATGIALMYLA